MNTLLEAYRSAAPSDTRSDDELNQILGAWHEQDQRYADYPDFLQDYGALKSRIESAKATPPPVDDAGTSALGAFGRAAATGVAPAAGAWGGFEAGAAMGAAGGPLVSLVTGLIGGIAGSVLADKAQSKAFKELAPELHKELEDYRQMDEERHPVASAAGRLAGNLPIFELNPLQSARGAAVLIKMARGKAVSEAEKEAAVAFAMQTGLGAGMGVVSPLVEGQAPTPAGITESLVNALLLGNARYGKHAAEAQATKSEPEPPATTATQIKPLDPTLEKLHFSNLTPEHRDYLDSLWLAQRDGTITPEQAQAVRKLDGFELSYWASIAARVQDLPVGETKPATPSPADTAAETPAAASNLSPENKGVADHTQALADLGYNETDRANLSPEDAQSIIAAGLRSPKERARSAAVAAIAETDPAVAKEKKKVDAAAAKTDTQPTEAQKEAGNYTKGKVEVQGLPISIENPKGSTRSGKDASGKPWSVEMPAHYGYILGTLGKDKDHIDVYIGPNPTADKVYVVDQINPGTGKFDEHKNLIGFNTREEALSAYDRAFSDGSGPKRRGAVTEMPMDQFKDWLKNGKTKQPMAYAEPKPEPASPPLPSKDIPITVKRPDGTTYEAGFNQHMPTKMEAGPDGEPIYSGFKPVLSVLKDGAWSTGSPLPEGHTIVKGEIPAAPPEPKPASAKADDSDKTAQTITGSNEQKGSEMPVQPKAGAATLASPETPTADLEKLVAAEAPVVKTVAPKKPVEKPANPLFSSEAMRLKSVESKEKLKATVDELNALWDADLAETGKLKLTLNPLDFLGVNPKIVLKLGEVAADALRLGYYKFGEFAAHFYELLGERGLKAASATYESMRKHFEGVGDLETLAKMTPGPRYDTNGNLIKGSGDEMMNAILEAGRRAERLENTGRKAAEVYPPEHVIKPEDISVGEHGTAEKSSRGRKDDSIARTEYERFSAGKNLAAWDTLGQDAKDVFVNSQRHPEDPKRTLRDKINEGRAVVEPAYFEVKDQNPESLAKRLYSDSSPPTKVNGKAALNSMTYRLAAVYDKATKKVHVISAYINNEKPFLTKFGDTGKANPNYKGVSLADVLGAKLPDGRARYNVIGSYRTNDLTSYYHAEYPNRKAYDKFRNDVQREQAQVQSSAQRMQSQMEAFGAEAGAKHRANVEQQVADAKTEVLAGADRSDAVEAPAIYRPEEAGPTAGLKLGGEDVPENQDVAEGSLHAANSAEDQGTGTINLAPHEVATLRELPVDKDGKLDVADVVDLVTDEDGVSDALRSVISKIAKSDISFFSRVEDVGLTKALKEYGYKTDAATGGQMEPGRAAEPRAGVQADQPRLPAGEGDPATVVAGEQDRAQQVPPVGEPQGRPATGGGEGVPDNAGTVKATNPGWQEIDTSVPKEPANPEHAALLNSIIGAARSAGIDMTIHNGELWANTSAGRIKINEGGAVYNPQQRSILQTIGAVVGRGEIKTALHEIGHDVFQHETPEVRSRLVSAIDKLSDSDLGVDLSADSRIRASDPAGLGKAGVNEERLVDSTAQRLLEQGFNPDEAKGFAQRFVRTLKDYYYRAVDAVQKMLGYDANPEMARRYFENRVKRLLAGDNTPHSYLDFIGARKLTPEETYHRDYQTANHPLGERIGPNGLEYDHQPELSMEAARFNLPSSPDAARDPAYERELSVSGYNHQIEVLGKAGAELTADPRLAEHIGNLKSKGVTLTPEKFIRRLLRITADPEQLKRELVAKPAPGGKDPVNFDSAKTIDGFKGKAAQGQANLAAQRNVDGLVSRTGNTISRKQGELRQFEKALARREKALEKAQTDYQDAKDAKNDAANNPKLDALIAVKKDRLEQAKRRVTRGKTSIAKVKTEIDVLHKVLPGFQAEQARLNARLGIGVEFTLRHDAPYVVVSDPNATSAEILGRAKGKATVERLQLDATSRMTDPKALEAQLRKNVEFLRTREAKARAGDADALDSVYQSVKNATNVLSAQKYTVDVATAERTRLGLVVSPEGQKLADGIGTMQARAFKSMLTLHNNVMEAFHRHVKTDGRKSLNGEDALLKLAPTLSRDTLRRDILSVAMHTMQHANDLGEKFADANLRDRAIFQRVKDDLLGNQATAAHIGANKEPFFAALWKHLNHTADVSAFQEQQARTGGGLKSELGLNVLDPRIKSVNPATGKAEVAARAALPIGPGKWTWRQRFSDSARAALTALNRSHWAALDTFFGEGVPTIAERYHEDPAKLAADLMAFTNHPDHHQTVRADFFEPLAQMQDKSPFLTPESGELARTQADAALVREAFEQSGFMDNGDVVKFAEKLFELHEGKGDLGSYVQETVGTFNNIYKELNNKLAEHDGTPAAQHVGIRGMIHNAFIDARTVDHLPGEWFDYHSYDPKDLFNTAQSIAGQTAFGRGGEKLAQSVEGMGREVKEAKDKIEGVVRDVTRANPNATAKEIKAALTARFGKELPTLQRQAQGGKLISSAVRGLSDYFRKDNSPDGSVRVGVRMLGTLGNLMVQQGTSAIRQLEQLDAIFLKYGVSKETGQAFTQMVKTVGNETVHSLAQALGVVMRDNSETHRLYVENNLHDPDLVVKWKGLADPLEGETAASRAFRVLNSALGMTANLRGEQDTHTGLRPLQPFTTMSMMVDKGLTGGVWNMATRFAGYGRKYYQAHPEHFNAGDFKLDADTLGLKGASRNTFNRFVADMQNHGIDFDSMVRNGLRRNDGTVLSPEEVKALYGLSVSVLSSESNLTTMPTAAYNNTVFQMVSPLLGWPFRRMMDVLSVGRTPEGKHSLGQFAHGLAGLGVMALGGLAVSGLANQYQEDLLGKKSNLRPIVGAGSPEEQMLSVFENLNRAGTFGLLGELANGAVNVGMGGDNRNILDANARVLALSSLGGVQQAISSFINQDKTADYTHVVRPLISSFGGGGLLQYMQLANNALGLDNAESRTTARLNAKNYLQVVGRQLGMEVRSRGSGGSYTPTPLSPYLTRMELAAYGNDAADFQQAFKEAVAQAKADGEADPVDHVKRAYAGRNPLKSVFATPLSAADYQKILATLPDDGRRDVSEAVDTFNRMAERIGARPFEGKAESAKRAGGNRLGQRSESAMRGRALSALYSN